MTDLKSMTPEELTAWCREQGQPAFRGRQLFQWLSRGVVLAVPDRYVRPQLVFL